MESSEGVQHQSLQLLPFTKESGVWLHALPISLCGLRTDHKTIRVGVCLRLGAPLCSPHQCCHCCTDVDSLATHGLSCQWSEGRNFHHAAINSIIQCSLKSAGVPSQLEPSGLLRSDGRCPDGISIALWKCGKCLI